MATQSTRPNGQASRPNLPARPLDTAKLTRQLLSQDSYKKRFEDILGKRAPQFAASIVNLAGSYQLEGCDPNDIVREALKAAILDFPIEPSLGFAFIIAYKEKGKPVPRMQLGWRAIVQLAIRSGQYKRMNAAYVNAEAYRGVDDVVGEAIIDWSAIDETKPPVGFVIAWQLLTGFSKIVYWSKEKCMAHGERYSRLYQNDLQYHTNYSRWTTDPDSMCQKSVVMNGLRRWGILSVEMRQAMDQDERVDLSGDGAFTDIPPESPLLTEEQRVKIVETKNDTKCPDEVLGQILERFGCALIAEIREDQLEAVIAAVGAWNGGEIPGDQKTAADPADLDAKEPEPATAKAPGAPEVGHKEMVSGLAQEAASNLPSHVRVIGDLVDALFETDMSVQEVGDLIAKHSGGARLPKDVRPELANTVANALGAKLNKRKRKAKR